MAFVLKFEIKVNVDVEFVVKFDVVVKDVVNLVLELFLLE